MTAKGENYILVWRDDLWFLVGPFADSPTAATWARANNPADDPRWNTIQPENPRRAPNIYAPDCGFTLDEIATIDRYLSAAPKRRRASAEDAA